MTFLKCSIGGVKYGTVTQEDKEKEQIVATGEFNPVQKQASQDNTQPSSPVWNYINSYVCGTERMYCRNAFSFEYLLITYNYW